MWSNSLIRVSRRRYHQRRAVHIVHQCYYNTDWFHANSPKILLGHSKYSFTVMFSKRIYSKCSRSISHQMFSRHFTPNVFETLQSKIFKAFYSERYFPKAIHSYQRRKMKIQSREASSLCTVQPGKGEGIEVVVELPDQGHPSKISSRRSVPIIHQCYDKTKVCRSSTIYMKSWSTV